jgi:hypothetical protein
MLEAARAGATIELQAHTFALGGAQAGLMTPTPAALAAADPAALRAAFARDGYVLVRAPAARLAGLAVGVAGLETLDQCSGASRWYPRDMYVLAMLRGSCYSSTSRGSRDAHTDLVRPAQVRGLLPRPLVAVVEAELRALLVARPQVRAVLLMPYPRLFGIDCHP